MLRVYEVLALSCSLQISENQKAYFIILHKQDHIMLSSVPFLYTTMLYFLLQGLTKFPEIKQETII